MAKSFNESTILEEDSLMIVDSLNLAFRYLHSKTASFSNEYLGTVRSLQKSYKAKHVILACDSGASSYRKGIYPFYKGARKEKQELQTEAEEHAFQLFIKEFNNAIDLASKTFPLLKFHKCEADDIAAYIVKYKDSFGIKKIWLISTDKDWDLLISEYVSRFSYVTRKEITYDSWSDHYDCSIEEYISLKCLMGDSGDSIPGIDGVGPAKAKGLIDQYGSALDVALALPITSKYKYIQNVNKFGRDNILLNYKLMDLLSYCEEALGQENIATINATMLKEMK